MGLPRYGSFIGTTTAGVNMVETFKQKEAERSGGLSPASIHFSMLLVEIHAPEGTTFKFNGQMVKITSSGVWRTPTRMEINEIVFDGTFSVNIMYLF